jgi:hypothetical protein
VLETHQCEECKKDNIGPDDAFIEIDIAADDPAASLRTVRLHLDCIEKFQLKLPSIEIPPVKTGAKRKK